MSIDFDKQNIPFIKLTDFGLASLDNNKWNDNSPKNMEKYTQFYLRVACRPNREDCSTNQ